MPIKAWVISLLVLALAPILLIRFRKRWVAAFNLAVTNRIASRFAAANLAGTEGFLFGDFDALANCVIGMIHVDAQSAELFFHLQYFRSEPGPGTALIVST